MELIISPLHGPPINDREFEIVERKGLGHPDTICDALAEQLSLSLSRFYLERFGMILHHNVDKALLWGGSATPSFGGGTVNAPIEIFLAGRAIHEYQGVTVPVEELVINEGRRWLRENLTALDPEQNVILHSLIRPGSADLVELFERQRAKGIWLANDTSCGAGYAPFSELENAVYHVELELNSEVTKDRYPEIGPDIKVMGTRQMDRIVLTIGCAFVDRHVANMNEYLASKQRVADISREAAARYTGSDLDVFVNTADEPDKESIYLTVTGTSGEAGDDGEAGRGNRANGLITPCRPMTMESVAGKNPVTHVGKLYNVIAGIISNDIVKHIPDAHEAECLLASQIGHPINDPPVVHVQVNTGESVLSEGVRSRIDQITRDHLSGVNEMWRHFLDGDLQLRP